MEQRLQKADRRLEYQTQSEITNLQSEIHMTHPLYRLGAAIPIVFGLTHGATTALAQELRRCEYETRQACGDAGCEPMESTNLNFLRIPSIETLRRAAAQPAGSDTLVVHRCDDLGCALVPVQTRLDGTYFNLVNADRGYQLRVPLGLEGGVDADGFFEVVPVLLTVLVSFGQCEASDPG